MPDLEKILEATLTGMSVDTFNREVKKWLATAKDSRYQRPYTALIYQPMLEAMKYLRANGYKAYIVTGGGQDFVRVYADQVYGIPPEQVVGTAGGTHFGYDAHGRPFLTKEPKLLLNDDHAGKPEGIHLHDDANREYAYGPAQGLPATKVGTFTQALYDEATKKGWTVISMKTTGTGSSHSKNK